MPFVMVCIESVDGLEKYSHFDNIDSSNPRTLYIFPSAVSSSIYLVSVL